MLRRSKYRIFEVSSSKSHTFHGVWTSDIGYVDLLGLEATGSYVHSGRAVRLARCHPGTAGLAWEGLGNCKGLDHGVS